MIIINSAAYVISEFRNELGSIPPCLLPLGNQKLLQHQVQTLKCFDEERIFVTLPSSYELTLDERKLISALGVESIAVPDGFSLAEALIYVLNVVADTDSGLRLLHGDTLIKDLPLKYDVVAVGKSSGDYEWEIESSTDNGGGDLIWAGFFAFSNQREFIRSLTLSRGSFVNAVRLYKSNFLLNSFLCKEWFDLGHVNIYFSSRSKITTQRSFNDIKINDGVLYKTGEPLEKIKAEEYWFRNVPLSLKKYTPHLLDAGEMSDGRSFYALEYLPYLPLNELFVHGRNPDNFWLKKFGLLKKFFIDAREAFFYREDVFDEIKSDAFSLYQEKTLSRLSAYEKDGNFSVDEVIGFYEDQPLTAALISKECIFRVLSMPVIPCVLHGDLCFSNILFDSRSERIKVIDPRGLNFESIFSIYGDQKYDLAKLAHSVIGLYDFIIAGRYSIEVDADGYEYIKFEIDHRLKSIQKIFMEIDFIDGLKVKSIMPLVVLLFLSMLPLHADKPDRQKAMLLNAVRLYKEII